MVCVCCYVLWNYGKVKDESVENLFFDFDFEWVVGVWLKKVYGRWVVVLMVVDGLDFDGLFLWKVVEVFVEVDEELGMVW